MVEVVADVVVGLTVVEVVVVVVDRSAAVRSVGYSNELFAVKYAGVL